jgi:hypothetical protein
MKKEKLGFGNVAGFFSRRRAEPALNKFPTYWSRLYLGTGTRLA